MIKHETSITRIKEFIYMTDDGEDLIYIELAEQTLTKSDDEKIIDKWGNCIISYYTESFQEVPVTRYLEYGDYTDADLMILKECKENGLKFLQEREFSDKESLENAEILKRNAWPL